MEILTVISPGLKTEKLRRMISDVVAGTGYDLELVTYREDWPVDYRGKKLLFAVELDDVGSDFEFMAYLKVLAASSPNFEGAHAALILNASSELFSKTFAKLAIFNLNSLGLGFIGKPLVEALPDDINLKTWQRHLPGTRPEILKKLCSDLGFRLSQAKPDKLDRLRLMVIHNSDLRTSNTLMLTHMVIQRLAQRLGERLQVEEIRLEEGTIRDCRGCTFHTCMTFAEQKACFYNGDNFDKIFASIEDTDAIVWVCPNYNDTISATLMATINRMSGIYRTVRLDHKRIYGVVVSANSGGDSVAMQLIDGLCLNKGFMLPPYFALIEIANEPLSVLRNKGIDTRIDAFAARIGL
ncbi:MAG: NADPH-dependent oxidoreductase [Acidaminobacter sp.]|uniref:flavodoxin family protein n=1 Tax=Acidaminobacter sp. TaxID=1872102 RepID=UPI00137CEA3A|nr:NAD(P)H-dependent oxidoreductase [Acidaminobacter sp.]MZQ97924.1 NADPH-dependent oxidoreductase [Acidaminobacter sp.]